MQIESDTDKHQVVYASGCCGLSNEGGQWSREIVSAIILSCGLKYCYVTLLKYVTFGGPPMPIWDNSAAL